MDDFKGKKIRPKKIGKNIENNEIKNLENDNKTLKNENQLLKKENQILKNENENLKKKLDNLNLIKNQEIKKIEEKYNILIKEKNDKINDLMIKLNNNNNTSNIKSYNNLLDGEKLIAINFISADNHINHSIICKDTTKFHDVEGYLYEKYPDYAECENLFMFNGIKINRWKTLEDNGVHGYTLTMKKIESK